MYARIPHPSHLALWRCIFPSPLRQTSRVGKKLRTHSPGSPRLLNDPLKAMELLPDSLHTNSRMSHIILKKLLTMDPGATTFDPVQAGEEGAGYVVQTGLTF